MWDTYLTSHLFSGAHICASSWPLENDVWRCSGHSFVTQSDSDSSAQCFHGVQWPSDSLCLQDTHQKTWALGQLGLGLEVCTLRLHQVGPQCSWRRVCKVSLPSHLYFASLGGREGLGSQGQGPTCPLASPLIMHSPLDKETDACEVA